MDPSLKEECVPTLGKRKSIAGQFDFPLLPLRDVVIFPGMIIPLFVGRSKSVAALEAGMQGDKRIVSGSTKEDGSG